MNIISKNVCSQPVVMMMSQHRCVLGSMSMFSTGTMLQLHSVTLCYRDSLLDNSSSLISQFDSIAKVVLASRMYREVMYCACGWLELP